MTAQARPIGLYGRLFLPLLKRLALRRIRRFERRVGTLGNRMGLLQLGSAQQLFADLPGLSKMATGGLDSKRSLAAMAEVLESDSNINWQQVATGLETIDRFLTDANMILDEHDRGRPPSEKFFVVRPELKGLF